MASKAGIKFSRAKIKVTVSSQEGKHIKITLDKGRMMSKLTILGAWNNTRRFWNRGHKIRIFLRETKKIK